MLKSIFNHQLLILVVTLMVELVYQVSTKNLNTNLISLKVY